MPGCGKPCECPSYRDHVASIGFAASAMPTRHVEAADTARREKSLVADMAAYKNIRSTGGQPERVAGSALLEARAETDIELKTGQVMNQTQRKQYQSVMDEVA